MLQLVRLRTSFSRKSLYSERAFSSESIQALSKAKKGAMMIMARRTIRPQERCFCIWYAMLCNVQEAALHAGYPQEEALERGVLLLQRADCRELIQSVLKSLSLRSPIPQVLAGLERLAFGSCPASGISFTGTQN